MCTACALLVFHLCCTALTGGPVHLKALNGQLLQLPLSDNTIITPNSELVLHNQVCVGSDCGGWACGRQEMLGGMEVSVGCQSLWRGSNRLLRPFRMQSASSG